MKFERRDDRCHGSCFRWNKFLGGPEEKFEVGELRRVGG